MTSTSASPAPTMKAGFAPTPVQKAALGVGTWFLVVGMLGFIPGITIDYRELQFAGHESRAMLFGVFQVSVLHNLMHLLFGAGAIIAARSISGARIMLLLGSLFYAVLWVYGLAVDPGSDANVLSLNTADNWLNFVLFIGMFGLGLLPPARPSAATARRATTIR